MAGLASTVTKDQWRRRHQFSRMCHEDLAQPGISTVCLRRRRRCRDGRVPAAISRWRRRRGSPSPRPPRQRQLPSKTTGRRRSDGEMQPGHDARLLRSVMPGFVETWWIDLVRTASKHRRHRRTWRPCGLRHACTAETHRRQRLIRKLLLASPTPASIDIL